jgi:WD40 repeat protein
MVLFLGCLLAARTGGQEPKGKVRATLKVEQPVAFLTFVPGSNALYITTPKVRREMAKLSPVNPLTVPKYTSAGWEVKILDPTSGTPAGSFSSPSGKIEGLYVSANGNVLVTREEQPTKQAIQSALVLRDPATGKLLSTLSADGGWFGEVALSDDGKVLAALRLGVRRDFKPRPGERPPAAWAVIWDTDTRKVRHWLPLPVPENLEQVRRDLAVGPPLALSPDGKVLAWNSGRERKFWDLTTGKEAAGFGENGKSLVVLRYDEQKDYHVLERRDLATAKVMAQIPVAVELAFAATAAPRVLACTPDAQTAVLTVNRDSLHVVEVASGKVKAVLRENGGTVTAAAFSPDGKLLAMATNRSGTVEVTVWEVPETARLSTLPMPPEVKKGASPFVKQPGWPPDKPIPPGGEKKPKAPLKPGNRPPLP